MSWEYTGSTVPPTAAVAIAAAADYAGRAEAASADATTTLRSVVSIEGTINDKITDATAAVTAAEAARDLAISAKDAAVTAQDASEESASAAAGSASAAAGYAADAAYDLAMIQAAQTAIAAIAVPALPHILDGLMPSVLLSAPSGAMQIDGAYEADISSLLTISSEQKRVIGPTGTLDMIGANQPAWDWSSGRRRLLIEAAQATNLFPYSIPTRGYGGAWSESLTTNAGVGPDGTTTASRIIVADGSEYLQRSVVSVTSGTAYSLAQWIKGPAGRRAHIWWYLAGTATGTSTSAVVTLTGGWQRIYAPPFTPTGSGSAYVRIDGIDGATATWAAGDQIYFWNSQLEIGSLSTSDIVCPGSATVTRIADDVRLSAAALAQVTGAGGCTIAVRGDTSIVTGATRGIISLYSNDASEQVLISRGSSTQANTLLVLHGGAVGGQKAIADADTGVSFGITLSVAPAGARMSSKGSAVVAAGTAITSSALAIGKLGNRAWGDTPMPQLYLDELVIWPFTGSNAGIQSQARAWA